MNKLLFLLPVLSGLLLYFGSRSNRGTKFVQQRLRMLTTSDSDTVGQALYRPQARTRVVPKGIGERIDALFEKTGNSVGMLHVFIVALVAAAITFVFTSRILGLDPSLVWFFSLVSACVAPVPFLMLAQVRYRRRFLDVFPDALDLIRRGVSAGLPVADALQVASRDVADPVGRELRRTFAQVQIGEPMIDALTNTADRIAIPDFRFLIVALTLQQKTGGSLAETLSNLSSVVRSRKALRLKARALTAEVKASASVLALLPFVVCGAMYGFNPVLVGLLFTDPRGLFMLGMSFLSLMTGLALMYVIAKRAMQ
jgi:tight adherence protein B